jgi:hypothetical protein
VKLALGIALLLVVAAVALLAMGYSFHFSAGSIDVVGPPRLSPYDAEAEANSPECIGLNERFPEKASYAAVEFEARTKAAQACIDAKDRYMTSKIRSR